jgi:hypothetical protein
MSRIYTVVLPMAEARYLAGLDRAWPPLSPAQSAVHGIREWLRGIQASRLEQVPVQKISDDIGPLLAQVPPATGPLSVHRGWPALPGRVEYLGAGKVAFDDAAFSALCELGGDDDFRIVLTDNEPVMLVSGTEYPVHAEGLD